MTLESEFTPRKEFQRNDNVSHDFALLALSSNNALRLYSFPVHVISNLRRLLLDRIGISSFREDSVQNFCEFILEGKPWGSPKAVVTESLLVSILAVFYSCNYTFLSLIDYGRESDDRLAMAFSTASPSSSSGSSLSLPPVKRTPFALSFPSATLLRVISPPLASTPAILQAVRGAWPRGVLSEKKIGDNCFEFKLKGYRWFQEDTFATDSLRHILSLLSALDAHSFTLLSSISLTNRSRVKDLWVFTSPVAPQDGSLSDSPNPSSFTSEVKRSLDLHSPRGAQSPPLSPRQFGHGKLPTEPAVSQSQSPDTHHTKAVSEVEPPRPHTLRKPAPRAQIPVSVIHDDQEDGYRTVLPSVISEGNQNMTGVGAGGASLSPETPDVFYSTSPFGQPPPSADVQPPSPPSPKAPVPVQAAVAAGPAFLRQDTIESSDGQREVEPEVEDSAGQDDPARPPSLGPLPPPSFPHDDDAPPEPSPSTIRDVLSPGAFRDSAISTGSDTTQEIPIKWTGSNDALEPPESRNPPLSGAPSSFSPAAPLATRDSSSTIPMIPGGWQPTPAEERTSELLGGDEHQEVDSPSEAALHKTSTNVRMPELNRAEVSRKSEVGVVDVNANEEAPPVPSISKDGAGSAPSPSSPPSEWVMIGADGPEQQNSPSDVGAASPAKPGVVTKESSSTGSSSRPSTAQTAANGTSSPQTQESNKPSTVRRLFSLRRDSAKDKVEQSLAAAAAKAHANNSPQPSEDEGPTSNAQSKSAKKAKPSLRQKLKLIGTPEASRKDDKRISID